MYILYIYMLLLGYLRPSSWCWSVQCWGKEKMAGQGGAGWSSLSFSVILTFSHFVFNVSLYFPVFVVCAMRMTWPRTILLPQMMGSDHMHGGFYFYSFSERSGTEYFWTINGNNLKYVCCSTRSDGGHQHWWFSEWSHCVIFTVNDPAELYLCD